MDNTSTPKVDEANPKNEFVNVFADFNLDAFGLILPENMTGLATGTMKDGVSKILEYFSFPSLNVVFSTYGKLAPAGDRPKQNLRPKALLDELEVKVVIKPIDKEGNELSQNSLSILGLEPSSIEVQTKVEDGESHSSSAIEYKPSISAIFDKVAELSKGGTEAEAEAVPVAAIATIASAAAQGLSLAFGSKKEDKPKKITRITRLTSLSGPHEFAWYLKSFDETKKDGIHFGSAFLQVSRDVSFIDVTATMHIDWAAISKVSNFPNEVYTFTKRIPIYHAKPPKTPLMTDFTSPNSIPIVVPRSDVKGLLGVNDEELNALINDKQLSAFGANQDPITKGSLIKLLSL